jgi:hypothetical protein
MDLNWIVVYKDETILPQYNPDGSENAYSDIDRENISEFHIIDPGMGNRTVYALALEEGDRLIFRKRHMTSGSGENIGTIYMIGWQKNIGGENVQSIGWIFPDGSIIQTGKFREDHRLFYGVEFMDFEDVVVSSEPMKEAVVVDDRF